MKIEAVWQKSGLNFKCTSPSQHTIDVDSGALGETNGPSPMEVLLEAAACCSGMDVVSILEKKQKTPREFSVTVEGQRAEYHPKKFTAIHLHCVITHHDVTDEEAHHIISLSVEKYCSVIASLSSETNVTWNFEVRR